MDCFEYMRARVYESGPNNDRNIPETRRKIVEGWFARLNELGAEGWELVTEYYSFDFNGSEASGSFVGTLKRRVSTRAE